MYVLIFMILVVNYIHYIRYQRYPVLKTELLYHYLKTKNEIKKKIKYALALVDGASGK